MSPRRPTVYDVAERAKVSIATVSFAFSRPDQISVATRERVLETAREIGYVPSASARGLARGRTGALGLHSFDLLIDRPLQREPATPAADDAPAAREPFAPGRTFIPWDEAGEIAADPRAFPLYVDEVRRGFELECRAHDRPVMLSRGSDTTTAVAESAGRVDGLAIFPGPSAAASLKRVSLRMPIVLFSYPPADDGHHRVTSDNAGGARELVRHLVVDHGITDTGFVGATSVGDYRERFEGYREALAEHGIEAPAEVLDDTVLGEGSGFAGVVAALRAGRLPRALVCASDQLALALVDLLRAEGVAVPGDVVVTGFDGILAGLLSSPRLTTVRQPMEAMGRAAARILIDTTSAPNASDPVALRLGTKLVVRESCGCRG
ncbi:LacI family DNA-binding transcriptional regulator [Clavibacter sp. CT19]|uniref:LacI family DNA-binding transcriptional regulator n=1 Tax=Clavibacter sp. CT19 TaxID=3018990 RepID=UPI0022EABC89|nr:LacI family DNA-binding transcriptional regulator [Clavibacter sp. CT19]MDA3803254.1 LacI family DNA-binding transcriptional regulator [Clavibacter sp. CT19]